MSRCYASQVEGERDASRSADATRLELNADTMRCELSLCDALRTRPNGRKIMQLHIQEYVKQSRLQIKRRARLRIERRPCEETLWESVFVSHALPFRHQAMIKTRQTDKETRRTCFELYEQQTPNQTGTYKQASRRKILILARAT